MEPPAIVYPSLSVFSSITAAPYLHLCDIELSTFQWQRKKSHFFYFYFFLETTIAYAEEVTSCHEEHMKEAEKEIDIV